LSRAVIYPDSVSAGLTTNPTNPAVATAITVFRLVPNLINDLSFTLLTSAVLCSFNLRSSAHLLLVYLFYFPSPFFLKKIVLIFLTSCSFPYLAYSAVL